jgi:hypothetical protein
MAGPAAQVLKSACAAQTLHVEAEDDGRALGHVFDLRCDWQPGAATHVDELIYGRTGLLERVGLREQPPDSLPWSAVRGLRGKAIVVARRAR